MNPYWFASVHRRLLPSCPFLSSQLGRRNLRIQCLVSQVLEQHAVELIRPRLGDCIHQSAALTSELGAELFVWTLNSCNASGLGMGLGAAL